MKPFGKRWQETRCLRVLWSFLPPVLARGIRYARFQDSTLLIALESHSLKAEFYHKRPVILSLFKKLQSEGSICSGYTLKSFRLIVSPPPVVWRPVSLRIRFKERALGRFENCAKNSGVHEQMERIRQAVLANHPQQERQVEHKEQGAK
jgi:hypothetical protein